MAILRIRFPENERPSVVLLEGARITIGRRANNTIQIVDRMVSSAHAELKWEGDHYLLRDLDSTNGTWVNDEQVSEFHLRESCSLRFGTFACEYDPQPVDGEGDQAEVLPSRSEMNALRQENSRLQGMISSLKSEVEALRISSSGAVPLAEGGIPRDVYDKAVTERQELQQKLAELDQELARAKADLALLRSERESLQQALQVGATGAAGQPAMTPASSAVPGAGVSAPAVLQPAHSRLPVARPAADSSSTSRPGVPVQDPGAPTRPLVPGAPKPRPMPLSNAPGAAVPAAMPRPAGAAMPVHPTGPAAVPVTRPAVQPAGGPKPPAGAPKAGSAGTEKIDRPAAAGQQVPRTIPRSGIQPFPRAVPGSTGVAGARPAGEQPQSDPAKSDESAAE